MTTSDRLFSVNRKRKKLKDKKIQIYKEIVKKDKFNTPIGKVISVVHAGLWAYVRQTSAKEYMEYNYISSQQYQVEMLFTINYRENLDNTMLIRYNDKWYSILRIDYFEGDKKDILILAKSAELELNRNNKVEIVSIS
ncbi:phage head closure protein [Tuanshanicoccus lijuaniae]|uniref:phage head closure protein n=1 Tax=Aerococcaceae bacterium zg-1292 TaxID=2774330 RepID=UPI001938E6CA|nr:phage head closure protein [Aerococcaceae bacterium zg-1292]MBS4456313.1 phage head closure protein [Aerococcaceae bacterium zg-A91]MBS4458100.1 phage head closure protein [Aerococcaceae bacterium zg-BR33]QQA37535.1 phage head closure protein [Aerococcaceae bacterium zg-1292]